MQKSLVAVALIGAASAAGLVYEYKPITSQYFSLALKLEADAGYTTGY